MAQRLVVVAPPRGGVPVAAEGARCLAEPEPFHAARAHDVDLHQLDDAEVTTAFGGEQRK